MRSFRTPRGVASTPETSRRRITAVLALACAVAAFALLVSRADAAESPAPTEGVWPLRPRPVLVAGFDPPATRFGSGHRGVDLAARPGAVVRTALAGRVTFAGRLAGRGVVVVSHGARRTTYEPVTASVHVGDQLATGAVIGRLELFGSHCFPRACLHWGLIEGADHYLDPLTLVGAAPVRLLPLFGSLTAVGPAASPAPPLPGLSAPPVAALLRPVGSGAGMGLAVGPAQPVGGDVGVDLRGGQ
jgi:murein DD-endopeptidase MepM/ murein hydrolase activator NlpD